MPRQPIPKYSPLLFVFIFILLAITIFLALKLISNAPNLTPSNATFENAMTIIDGDTFETADGEKIRLLCVDTPEKGEKGYNEAGDYLGVMILGRDIIIERSGFDKYNRTLAWISVNTLNGAILVNKEIVNNGFGKLFPYNGTNCTRMNSR